MWNESALEHYGIVSLIPTVVVLVVAIATRRPVESLIVGALVGFLILSPGDPLTAFTDGMLAVMQNETVGWVILVCVLFGSLIMLLVRIGAARKFGESAARRIRTRRGSLLTTCALGLLIFIDDYLNALAVSSSLKPVTDRYRVSRSQQRGSFVLYPDIRRIEVLDEHQNTEFCGRSFLQEGSWYLRREWFRSGGGDGVVSVR